MWFCSLDALLVGVLASSDEWMSGRGGFARAWGGSPAPLQRLHYKFVCVRYNLSAVFMNFKKLEMQK